MKIEVDIHIDNMSDLLKTMELVARQLAGGKTEVQIIEHEEAPAVTLDDISRAGAALFADPSKQAAAMELFSKYGIKSLGALPKDQYAAFAADLRALGAAI